MFEQIVVHYSSKNNASKTLLTFNFIGSTKFIWDSKELGWSMWILINLIKCVRKCVLDSIFLALFKLKTKNIDLIFFLIFILTLSPTTLNHRSDHYFDQRRRRLWPPLTTTLTMSTTDDLNFDHRQPPFRPPLSLPLTTIDYHYDHCWPLFLLPLQLLTFTTKTIIYQ